jgi:hypothetical protein
VSWNTPEPKKWNSPLRPYVYMVKACPRNWSWRYRCICECAKWKWYLKRGNKYFLISFFTSCNISLFSCFLDRVSCFLPGIDLRLLSSYLHLPYGWDYRCEPPYPASLLRWGLTKFLPLLASN